MLLLDELLDGADGCVGGTLCEVQLELGVTADDVDRKRVHDV